MPYGSKYGSKRKRRYGSKYGSKKKKVPSNKKLAMRIKRIENATEVKWDDFYSTVTAYRTGNYFTPMEMPTGTWASSNRIGAEVTYKKYEFRCYFQSQFEQFLQPLMVRIVIVIDRQSNGNTSFPLFVSGSGSSPTTALMDDQVVTDHMLTPYNKLTEERFKILVDKVIVLDQYAEGSTLSTGAERVAYWHKTVNLGGLKVKFGDVGLSTNFPSKQLVFCVWSNALTGNNNGAVCSISGRGFFTDT